MNIQKASELTGLTKKAIKHYEEQSLITVSKNNANNYREYTDENIIKLKLIASLRLLDLSIDDIKQFFNNEKSMPTLLQEHVTKIDTELEILQQKKLLATMVINKLSEMNEFSTIVQKLSYTLNLDTLGKREYISDELKRIFPGSFGTLIATVYEPFLNFNISTKETKELWLKLVEALDDIDDIPNSHPILQFIENNMENNLQDYKEKNRELVNKLLSNDIETKQYQKNAIVALVKSLQNSEECREKYLKQINLAKDIPQLKESSPFSNLLSVLSPDYSKLLKIQQEIKAEADAELNLDSKQFLYNLANQM
ncbi:transcriptional regulator [Bacillus anthracis]|nr:transcriptional regulator [Bacillus anthracis]